jgi:hypothetical protein
MSAPGSQQIGTWDFLQKHVDTSALSKNGDGTARGNYISSESIILCAGPSTLSLANTQTLSTVIPIGVCDSIQVAQNKGVITLYEIGSRIPYIIPGRPVTQFQISRVLFNGDSLLGALSRGIVAATEADPTTYSSSVMGGPGEGFTYNGQPKDNTGAFYLNLASHFFNAPFGIAIFFKDSEQDWVAGFYAENCVIQQHSMAIQGQNMVVMENASVRCTTFQPIPTVATTSTGNGGTGGTL